MRIDAIAIDDRREDDEERSQNGEAGARVRCTSARPGRTSRTNATNARRDITGPRRMVMMFVINS